MAGYHAMLGGLAGNTAALSVDAGDWSARPTNTEMHWPPVPLMRWWEPLNAVTCG